MSVKKHDKREHEIRNLIASFINTISNRESLITVTSAILSDNGGRMQVRVTVLPENKEDVALSFLSRNERDAREYLKKHGRLSRIPRITFVLDSGEKNRQRLDELSQ